MSFSLEVVGLPYFEKLPENCPAPAEIFRSFPDEGAQRQYASL